MINHALKRELCTGCSACYSACNLRCITMVEDEEGFLYPRVSNECVKCGKCLKVCPIYSHKKNILGYKQNSFAAVSKKRQVWERSSSGGAFSEICRAWGDDDTLFVGAAFNKLKVQHIGVYGYNNITPLCKSKYVASEIGDSFIEIENFLKQGGRVVFCGTPCQNAGLKSFLGKDYQNILLIDIICHGVGSPKVFKTCLDSITKHYSDTVIEYEFRNKKKYFVTPHIQKVKFSSGKERLLVDDPYMQLFIKQDCLRSSCGKNCIFRDIHRVGDITIGDFKGLSDVYPQLAGNKFNYSTIVFNTDKGRTILPKLETYMDMYECDLESIKKYNPLIYKHSWFSKDRDSFFIDFIQDNQEAVKKWTHPANEYRQNIIKSLYYEMPSFVRKWIILFKKVLKR